SHFVNSDRNNSSMRQSALFCIFLTRIYAESVFDFLNYVEIESVATATPPSINPLPCSAFVTVPGAPTECYCEERTQDRVTTNGLCTLDGNDPCPPGLVSVYGTCAGTGAIAKVLKTDCISGMRFFYGDCVPYEAMYANARAPYAFGSVGAEHKCYSHLKKGGRCIPNALLVDVRVGSVTSQVLTFNSVDEQVFLGDCGYQNTRQPTFCSTKPDWAGAKNCKHSEGHMGWTRTFDMEGCMGNTFFHERTLCNYHGVRVAGSGGERCFGYIPGSVVPKAPNTWVVWDGGYEASGRQLSEMEVMALPRVIIIPLPRDAKDQAVF
ncbi:hypothetical protein PENTCL1PPCAC_20952, partial [Pristionchus entomophagus]